MARMSERGKRGGRMRTRERLSRFPVPLLYHYTPQAKHLRPSDRWTVGLLHTTVMFYQPLRPCQSMGGMFQNIFNTQREHFGLRKWIVRKIGRGTLWTCQSPTALCFLPLSKALRTKTFYLCLLF